MNIENFIDKTELKNYQIEKINKLIDELNINLESHYRTLDYYIKETDKLTEDQWKTLNKTFRENITILENKKSELRERLQTILNK